MKKYLLIAVTVLFFQPGYTQTGENVYLFSYFKDNGQDGLHLAYSYDGFKWTALKKDQSFLKPAVAKDKLMRDPCIVRGADGKFHMVWTVSWNDGGIGYANSTDLVNWSEQQFVPVMKDEPAARNCWAPEIFYDAKKKEYMIYWATTIPGRFAAGDTAGDDKYNHRMYYTTTKDFKTYSKTKLLYDYRFNVIDATIQKNGNQYIMFLKDETKEPAQKNIRIATSKKLTGGYSKPSEPITGKYWAEGPTVLKIGDKWVVYFDKYTLHRYGAIESTDLKTWTEVSEKLTMPKGIRHGTVFTITQAELAKLIAL
ncbi:MAG: glycoside hydrolase family 43 protein [Ferruginibacter sp.]|nr:glycoside hydrolase family 43 protein [Ferruginibacter sp.]